MCYINDISNTVSLVTSLPKLAGCSVWLMIINLESESKMRFTEQEKQVIVSELQKMLDPEFYTCKFLFEDLFLQSKEILIEFNTLWLAESDRRMKAIGLTSVPMPV